MNKKPITTISIILIVIIVLVLFLIRYFSLPFVVWLNDMKTPSKEDIIDYVNENKDSIIQAVSQINELQTEYYNSGPGIKVTYISHTKIYDYIDEVDGLFIRVDDYINGSTYKEIDNIILENIISNNPVKSIDIHDDGFSFDCGGKGIGSATSCYGFYYSESNSLDVMSGSQYPKDGELTPDGKGFSWNEPDGDNRFYVEKIANCFYYYESFY